MSAKVCVNALECGGLPVNCRIYRGQLLPSLTPKRLGGGVPEGVIYACHAEGAGRFFVCTESGVYVSGSGTNFVELIPHSGSTPFLIESIKDGKPLAVVISGGKCVIHTGQSFMGHTTGLNLSCGIMRCGRLFGVDGEDRLKIIWTDGEGFGLGGSVTLDPELGSVTGIAELGEKLVFIRKFGLSTANMFGSPENFSIDTVGFGTDETVQGTAAVVGGKLIFSTVSGLCSFDGSAVERIDCRCSQDMERPHSAVAFNGKYYIACYSKLLKRNAVACYDPTDGESFLVDTEADALCAADGVYAFNSLGTYRLEEGGEYSFTTEEINFGGGGYKTVTRAFFDCDGADFEISNGRVTRKYSGVCGALRPRLRGKSFTVIVRGKVPVKKLNLTAEACDEI